MSKINHPEYLKFQRTVFNMTPVQKWALRVALIAERRLRTEAKAISLPSDTHMQLAYEWALSQVSDDLTGIVPPKQDEES